MVSHKPEHPTSLSDSSKRAAPSSQQPATGGSLSHPQALPCDVYVGMRAFTKPSKPHTVHNAIASQPALCSTEKGHSPCIISARVSTLRGIGTRCIVLCCREACGTSSRKLCRPKTVKKFSTYNRSSFKNSKHLRPPRA